MDITQFEQRVRDPLRTCEELQNMKKNALAKGNREFAKIADEVLCERFPAKTKRGGSTPTIATFGSESRSFDTGKDAYVWLIEQFYRHQKDVLDILIAQPRKNKICHFAKNPDDLFPENSPHRGNSSHYVGLSCGWYAYTNLNHKDKFKELLSLSYVCKLEYGSNWELMVEGATDALLERQKGTKWAQEWLKDFMKSKRSE